MHPQTQDITLFDNVTPVAVTSSTDATPIVVTATAHGLKTGQRVLIFGHTTNVAANGIHVVGAVTTNTFGLTDEVTGAATSGSGGGAGSSGICLLSPPVALVTGFKNAILQFSTSGTATTTVKAAGSLGINLPDQVSPRGAYPNMGGTVGPTNPYSFIQVIPLDTETAVSGATGIVVAGTDVSNTWEINIQALNYLTLIPISWSAGAITARLLLTTNA